MKKIGMIGASPGNGHPFSFAAIINGYDPHHLERSGYPQIAEYVRKRDEAEIGFADAYVTHAWTPQPETTERLLHACLIPHQTKSAAEMIGCVDAVIIARDDAETHYRLAMPFLRAGLPVFVDKPLTVCPQELESFMPYLNCGQLMSASAMRFARELDGIRTDWHSFGTVRLVRGTILNSWERYGVHMLEAIFSLPLPQPTTVQRLEADHESVAISCGTTAVQIDALGRVPPVFKLEIYGTRKHATVEITDNFTMFRRMLWHFLRMCDSGKPAILPASTRSIMNVLLAGTRVLTTGRGIKLHEISDTTSI